MPFYQKGDTRINYEEAGSGFPLLIIPGGGLNSTISFLTGIKWGQCNFSARQQPLRGIEKLH